MKSTLSPVAAPASWAGSSFFHRLALGARDILLVTVLALYGSAVLLSYSYETYVQPMIESYRRQDRLAEDDFHADMDNDFTYYHRHCSKLDISTTSSTDLLVQTDMTSDQAANLMLHHGAVAFQNILDNSTVAELRAYLASRHAIRHKLSWNEVFWDGEEGTRLSLGIGTQDHPSIQKALEQIGRNDIVKRTVQGIMGEDPAIVELSTLTSLSGAHDQGIHSDTDWFGSSLNYARNFVHSYSFFVALQDTPQELGATTVCPGTHYCADEDLERVCLQNGAFSVSTNGYTGPEHGLLRKGDAFMFNQNVWHRGPKVQDVDDQHTDRVMFILTFVSRNKASAADHRQLGLGSYYYQRWNMWGATFDCLKNAGTVMVQPWAALRALGLYRPAGQRHIGWYWLETFAQQMATAEYFYEPETLQEFKERVLNAISFPSFLHSESDEWESFLPETFRLWSTIFADLYLVVFIGSCIALGMAFLPNGNVDADDAEESCTTPQNRNFGWKRLLWIHVVMGGLFYAGFCYVDRTPLAQSVRSGDVFVRPFPAPLADQTTNTVGPSTFPERNDVLVATRYDAEWLASYDHFLDNHPGNAEWQSMVQLAATHLPLQVYHEAAQVIVSTMQSRQREMGYPSSRFLWQDPDTGAWRILSQAAAVEETRRAILARANPLVGRTWQSLKYFLAEARFGSQRDMEMSRQIVPSFVQHVVEALFDVQRNSALQPNVCHVEENSDGSLPSTWKGKFQEWLNSNGECNAKAPAKEESADGIFKAGDMIWVRINKGYHTWTWHEATLLEKMENRDWWLVEFLSDTQSRVSSQQIRRYLHVREGDRVSVDFNEDGTVFYAGTVTLVKPNGRVSVLFDDGDFESNVRRQHILALDA